MTNEQNTPENLARLVEAFNARRYDDAEAMAAAMLDEAVGREELLWMGLRETCTAFGLIADGQLKKVGPILVAAMEKLRNFGYRYETLEVTSVLAGLRLGAEESRAVLAGEKTMFDMSLLPKLKMSAKAEDV